MKHTNRFTIYCSIRKKSEQIINNNYSLKKKALNCNFYIKGVLLHSDESLHSCRIFTYLNLNVILIVPWPKSFKWKFANHSVEFFFSFTKAEKRRTYKLNYIPHFLNCILDYVLRHALFTICLASCIYFYCVSF